MKSLKFDIWFSSHASQFDLHSKQHTGDVYNRAAFINQNGYKEPLSEIYRKRKKQKSKNTNRPFVYILFTAQYCLLLSL